MGSAMQKCVFGHMWTVKAQIGHMWTVKAQIGHTVYVDSESPD